MCGEEPHPTRGEASAQNTADPKVCTVQNCPQTYDVRAEPVRLMTVVEYVKNDAILDIRRLLRGNSALPIMWLCLVYLILLPGHVTSQLILQKKN